MAKQVINIGQAANDRSGDPLRTAFQKVNSNFTELYTAITGGVNFAQVNADWNAVSGVARILNKPTIPTNTNQLTNGAGFITSTDELVNGVHTVSLGSTGALTMPDGLTINNSAIGYSTSDTITEETPGGTVSQTTSYQNQIIVDTTDAIRIANILTQTVDDTVTVSTDAVGSTIDVDGTGIYIKRYVEPDGPNNSSYFQFSTNNSGAIIEGVNEDLAGDTYGRVTASQGVVLVNTAAGGIDKEWAFTSDSEFLVPEASYIIGTNDLTIKSQVDGNISGLFLNGNTAVGTAVLYAHNNAIISADYNGTVKDWNFDKSGTLTTPSLLPRAFTATVDAAHYAGEGSLTLEGDAWYFAVEFNINASGSVETIITNNTPWSSNPGYSNNMPFEFSEVDHGIPGYTFTLTLTDIQNPGMFMYTTNLAASIPPVLPATISNPEAVKLTADATSWTFSADGNLTVPGNINIGDLTIERGFPGLTVATGNNLSVGTSRYDIVSANAYIGNGDVFSADIEFNDDITVVQVGWILVGLDLPVTAVDASVGNQYRITVDGAVFGTGTTYTFRNPTPTPYSWVFGNNGVLTTPASGTISHLNNDLKLEVTGTDVIVLRTVGGDVYVDASGRLVVGGAIATDRSNAYIELAGPTNETLIANNNAPVILRVFDSNNVNPDKDWVFGVQGKLQLPAGGDIIDSNGVSVLGGSGADLGLLKISASTIGTKNNPDSGGWGDYSLYLDPGGESSGYIQIPSVTGQQSGGELVIANNAVNNGGIRLSVNTGNYIFADTGLEVPYNLPIRQNNSWTKVTTPTVNFDQLGTVVWTSTVDYISSAKLIIQVEADEAQDTTGWHSQACEAIIACRGYANMGPTGDPQMIVYGVVHTSVNPLVTFTVRRNPGTNIVEVIGTLTATAASAANLRIHSVEMSTRD